MNMKIALQGTDADQSPEHRNCDANKLKNFPSNSAI